MILYVLIAMVAGWLPMRCSRPVVWNRFFCRPAVRISMPTVHGSCAPLR
jgi:hypothetical protein